MNPGFYGDDPRTLAANDPRPDYGRDHPVIRAQEPAPIYGREPQPLQGG